MLLSTTRIVEGEKQDRRCASVRDLGDPISLQEGVGGSVAPQHQINRVVAALKSSEEAATTQTEWKDEFTSNACYRYQRSPCVTNAILQGRIVPIANPNAEQSDAK